MRRSFLFIFPLAGLLWWMQLQHLKRNEVLQHSNVNFKSNEVQTTQEFLAKHNDTYILHYPFTEFGQMCNNMHQISAAIDLALAFPLPKRHETKMLVLAFDEDMGSLIRASFDVEYLYFMLRQSARIKFADLNPEFGFYTKIELLLDWPRDWTKEFHFGRHVVFTLSPKRFQFSYGDSFSFGAALFVQPRADLKSNVHEWSRSNPFTLSMHRRNFYKCNPEKRQYSPFCRYGKSAQWRSLRYFENDCNVTWTPRLENELKQLWPQLPQNFTILLATDSNDKAGDSTFPQTVSIPQSVWQFPVSPKQQKRLGVGSTWDLSMLMDMWGQVLAPYSIGQPWSSCDRILAMWKSKYSRAAYHVYTFKPQAFSFEELNKTLAKDGRAQLRMFPVKCYSDFESPSSPQVALKVVQGMRIWWESVGLKHNVTLPRQQYNFPPQSMERVAVKRKMLQELLRRHRELKHKIHTTRIPLGRRGRIIMTCVYFFTPMLVGKVLFDWTNKSRNAKWGLDDQGRLNAQQEKRVFETDSSKLTDPKSRLEQVFAAAGASTPPSA